MTILFEEFPQSYRWSQAGIGAALIALAVGRPFVRIFPQPIQGAALGILAAVVICSLLTSHYVIIRYPFISLVPPDDGDPYAKHFPSHGSWIYIVLKVFALITPAGIAAVIVLVGFKDWISVLVFTYCIILTLFMLFFIFVYDPIKHPTISTFVRSTLGLGIALYPIYALTIFIGSFRCRRALNNAEN